MLKKQFTISSKFMIFLSYFIFSSILVSYGIDNYRFKGPKYQAPKTAEAVSLFRKKCAEFQIEKICAEGFKNLVRIDIVNEIYYQSDSSLKTTTIGLTEYSFFSPRTKISIDSRLSFDKIFFDSTVIHELGHAVLNLEHDDSKVAIMNSVLRNSDGLEQNYEALIDDMFKDYVNKK